MNNKLIYYNTLLKEGCDQWITFVHGAGGSSIIWHKQMRFFKEHFNLLFIDLRGHGKSNETILPKNYDLEMATQDILDVMDLLKIKKANFIGVSLGTILATKISKDYPHRVNKMILCGAITKLSFRTNFLLYLADLIKGFIPPIILYKLFAYIIMPKQNHRQSRLLFIGEAKKIRHKVFKRWLTLLPEVRKSIKEFSDLTINKPTLFISGEEDHLFVNHIKEFVSSRINCTLFKVPKSGHIANNDQPLIFNQKTLEFLLHERA